MIRVFTIHFQNFSPALDRNAIVVAEGFCWTAFFLAPLWAATHRMWFSALGFSAAYTLIFLFADLVGLGQVTTLAIFIGTAAIIGLCANDLRRTSLTLRGWHLAGLAAAPDRDTALRRFIDLRPETFDRRSPTARY